MRTRARAHTRHHLHQYHHVIANINITTATTASDQIYNKLTEVYLD